MGEKQMCTRCNGRGTCQRCYGSGDVTDKASLNPLIRDTTKICPACKGSCNCNVCGGSGRV